ncbi:MAG: DinB family protein [Anaerolineales bacterium]
MQPFFEDYLQNLQDLHTDILNAFKDLAVAALDWSPATDINSINVLVVHTVGAERFWIGEVVGGDPANRDREAEFQVHGLETETLVQRLNEGFAYIHSTLENLTIDDLNALRSLPKRERSVSWILGHVLKHTATHLGHIQLMRQVWELYGEHDG